MKILFIISSLSSGGAERVLSNLANHLCQKHDIIIATFSNVDAFYPLDKRVKHLKLDLLKQSTSSWDSVRNNLNRFVVLVKLIKEVSADINISFMTQTNILAILASRLVRQKIIIAERTVYDFYQSKIINLARRITYPLSDYLITQTIVDSKNYTFVKNIEVIYNPLFMHGIESKKEKIVLAAGRLDRQKGFQLLIEAFNRLDSSAWKLVIAGDGVQREELLHLIDELKIDNVELIGKRTDLFSWYAKASIFVLSSQKEGFPNVLLEAMASGCAVVSFDCPHGPREIIDNMINGILVENQNRKKLAQTMQRLMNDAELRDRLSKEAIKVKEKYQMEKIAKQWEEIFKRVVYND